MLLFFDKFRDAQNLENRAPVCTGAKFSENRVTLCRHRLLKKNVWFYDPEDTKIREKSIQNTCRNVERIFLVPEVYLELQHGLRKPSRGGEKVRGGGGGLGENSATEKAKQFWIFEILKIKNFQNYFENFEN